MDAFIFALALLLFCLATAHDVKRIVLARPREQLLALVRDKGGTVDAIEISQRAAELRWGTEALHTLLSDGFLREGLAPPVARPTSPPALPGQCVVSQDLAVVVFLVDCTSRTKRP